MTTDVYPSVARLLSYLLIPSLCLGATDFSSALHNVEKKYNQANTLQMSFQQTIKAPGRIGTRESGTLSLRKPGRMLWDYNKPLGKFYLTDGKFAYFYNPAAHTVEREKMKESDDLRTPLAFLIGRLDFYRDFQQFTYKQDGSDLYVVALPKSEKAPYKQVEFKLTPQSEISYVKVIGQDRETMEFQFSGLQVNPNVSEGLFAFHMPAGATLQEPTEADGPR